MQKLEIPMNTQDVILLPNEERDQCPHLDGVPENNKRKRNRRTLGCEQCVERKTKVCRYSLTMHRYLTCF